MANGRITWNRTLTLGQQIARVGAAGVEFRKAVAELDRIFGKYDTDNAAIVTESGVADQTTAQTLRDLTARAAGEMAGTALVAVSQGAQTQTRSLLDAIG